MSTSYPGSISAPNLSTTSAPAGPNSARPREPPRTVVSTPPRDRIDSILSGARSHKAVMDTSPDSPPSTSPRTQELRSSPDGHGDTESSADEGTSMVRRSSRQSMNYQATGPQHGDNTVRQHPSTTSIRRTGRVHQPGDEVHDDEDEDGSWWTRQLSKYGSLELENKGSVARDHLALERTFLAWLRTSLAFASIGIAITQLFRLNVTSLGSNGSDPYAHLRQMGKPLGATFLGVSIAILFVGFHRYFESQHWIIRGKFPASRGSIALVAAITFALMVASLVIVIVVEPTAFEKKRSIEEL